MTKHLAAIELVLAERDYQQQRWGTEHDAKHTADEWIAILSIWLGKTAMEAPIYTGRKSSRDSFNRRLAQVAAICMAAIEANTGEESTLLQAGHTRKEDLPSP